jgi:hypothetical protein
MLMISAPPWGTKLSANAKAAAVLPLAVGPTIAMASTDRSGRLKPLGVGLLEIM